jgi:hypothetical protein
MHFSDSWDASVALTHNITTSLEPESAHAILSS